MREYVYHIKKEIKTRGSKENQSKNTIGSAIKFARKSKRLTLEEASENLSSCSYLSKIENNKIIPSPKFKKLYEERLDIKLDFEVNAEFNEDINDLIKAFLFSTSYSRNKLEKYINKHNHESNLLHLGVSSLNNDYENLHKNYETLKNYIVNLSDKELGVFLIVLANSANERGYYQTVYDLIKLIPNEIYEDSYIAALAYKLKLSSIYNMNLILEVESNFNAYEALLKDIYAYNKLMPEARNDYLLYYSQKLELEKLKEIILNLEYNNEELRMLLKAIYYFRKNDLKKSLNIIKKHIYKNETWLVLGLLILGYTDIEEMKEVLKNDFNHLLVKEHSFVLTKYLKARYFGSDKDLFSFIKNELTLRNNITDNFFVLSFILKDLKTFYASRNLYKDANETANRLLLLVSDTLSTINNFNN